MSVEQGSANNGRYVQANGLRIYYEEYGAGEPLILIHGGTLTSSSFRPHGPLFGRHFRVIAPDSRGHGHTANPSGEMSYRTMADDVAAMIEAMGLVKPLVCGYSDGGQTALEIGMRYPDLCWALVVGAAWYTFTDAYIHGIKALGMEGPDVVDFDKVQSAYPGLIEFWSAEHAPLGGSEAWKSMFRQAARMWWTALDYTSDDFARITAPTLVLQGDRDGIIPVEQGMGMYRQIPHAELAILPGRDHLAALAAPSGAEGSTGYEPFATVVLDFLLRHRGSRGERRAL